MGERIRKKKKNSKSELEVCLLHLHSFFPAPVPTLMGQEHRCLGSGVYDVGCYGYGI